MDMVGDEGMVRWYDKGSYCVLQGVNRDGLRGDRGKKWGERKGTCILAKENPFSVQSPKKNSLI